MSWLDRVTFTIYPPNYGPSPAHLWTAEASIPGHDPDSLDTYGNDPREALDDLLELLDAIQPAERTDIPTVSEMVGIWGQVVTALIKQNRR